MPIYSLTGIPEPPSDPYIYIYINICAYMYMEGLFNRSLRRLRDGNPRYGNSNGKEHGTDTGTFPKAYRHGSKKLKLRCIGIDGVWVFCLWLGRNDGLVVLMQTPML